jgi:hypothetical protein
MPPHAARCRCATFSEHLSRICIYIDEVHRPQVIDLWTIALGPATGHNDPDLGIDRKLAVRDGLFLFFAALDGDRVAGTTMAGYDGHWGRYESLGYAVETHISMGRRVVENFPAA